MTFNVILVENDAIRCHNEGWNKNQIFYTIYSHHYFLYVVIFLILNTLGYVNNFLDDFIYFLNIKCGVKTYQVFKK